MEWVIEQCADGNLPTHSVVTELIQHGHWSKPVDLLYNDAEELAMTIPPQTEVDIEKMSASIGAVKHEFITVNEGNEAFLEA